MTSTAGMSNYPDGAFNDPRAPYNEPDYDAMAYAAYEYVHDHLDAMRLLLEGAIRWGERADKRYETECADVGCYPFDDIKSIVSTLEGVLEDIATIRHA